MIHDLKEQLAKEEKNEFYIADICFPFSSGGAPVLEDSVETQRTFSAGSELLFLYTESSWAGGLLLLTTAVTYLAGIAIEKGRHRRTWLILLWLCAWDF